MKVFQTDYKTQIPKGAIIYVCDDVLIAVDKTDNNNLIVISGANSWRRTLTAILKVVLDFFEAGNDYVSYSVYNHRIDKFIRRIFEVGAIEGFIGVNGEELKSGIIYSTETNKKKAKETIDKFTKDTV